MPPIYPFPHFVGFQPSPPFLPSFYAQADDLEQRILHLCKEYCKLIQFSDGLADNVNAWKKLTEDIFNEFEEFKAHGFDDYYREQICEFINSQLPCIVSNAARFVQFGLTDDGYLVATIPNSWDFLDFYTNTDTESEDFGRLIITY